MSFATIYKRTYRPDEKITLMKFSDSAEEDELGFSKKGYVDIQELQGIIQRPQDIEVLMKGVESNPNYIGYFIPDFILKQNEIDDYRLRYERPFEVMILKIDEYNPNLFLRHDRDHIRLKLILEKKHGSSRS